jgi:ACS family tartrate transporter-like MFS transporter
VFWCLPSMLLRGAGAAAGIALVNSVGNIGGLIGPYVAGWFLDATGSTRGAFLGLALPALLASVLTLMLRRKAAFATPPTAVVVLTRPASRRVPAGSGSD